MPRVEFKVRRKPVPGDAVARWDELGVTCRADMDSIQAANAYARLLLKTLGDDVEEIRWNWQGSPMGHYNHARGEVTNDNVVVVVLHRIVNPDTNEILADPGTYHLEDPEIQGLFVEMSSRRSLRDQREQERNWWYDLLEGNPDDWVAEESYHKMAYEFCLHRRLLDEYEDELSLEAQYD